MTRREFIPRSVCFTAAAALGLQKVVAAISTTKYRAAIIGDTGHGNYGHEHDLIFSGRENITVVGVADPDAGGRAKAAARTHALRQYADYLEMLEKEKPQLVCVAPRWTDRHHDMALSALKIGAHVYVEKPFMQTLKEADDVLAVAKTGGLKIVVAHQVRLAPNILALKAALDGGLIGELLEIRAHGKQDKRAGGEDLIVLGVHLFDLMRFFAGDAEWCAARILQNGHEITLADVHPATEHIGPIGGDEIDAQFSFAKGVHGSFTSRGRNHDAAGPWGLEMLGTKASVKIEMDMIPKILTRKNGSDEWALWKDDPTRNFSEVQKNFAHANERVVDDWLEAIERKRAPVCSGYAGMKAVEMAMAVFEAGLANGRVEIPLRKRQHPLRGG
jgi:predicted dehydrogenase